MDAYSRPDFQDLRVRVQNHTAALRGASDAQQAIAEVLRWDELRSQMHAMLGYARLHHTVDSASEAARTEMQFWNGHAGDMGELDAAFGAALIACPHRSALEQHFGAQILQIAECDSVGASSKAESLVDEEAHLVGRYHELTSGTAAEVQGAPYNVLKVRKLLDSPNQNLRREAWVIREKFCQDHADEIDEIFDRLVHLRNQIAIAASLPDYVQFGHRLVRRIGYSAEDVGRFLTGVEDHLAPLAHSQIRKRQRLFGGDEFRLWDEEAPPPGTTPSIEMKPSQALRALSQLFGEVHPEFEQFMETMTSKNLFDLDSRSGKTGLCQCCVFPDVRLPFVVAQMDGKARDVWSLLHESGHAFHAYRARSVPLMDYIWPTSEGAELGAGGLTYLCMGKTAHFFGEHVDVEEKKEHERLLISVLRGAQMERFQQAIYSEPSMSPLGRRELWANLEHKYLPWRQYPAEFPRLEAGAGYTLIPHLFGWPFAGLDFALASVSVQFHKRAQDDQERAASDYIAMCDLGGRRSFPELLDAASLDSPFEPRTLQEMAEYVGAVLEA